MPEIDEVILSLNYQPRRIEEIFGDGAGTGVRLRYVVEPAPLGTGGAIRYAAQGIDRHARRLQRRRHDRVDVNAVVALHRERKAKATIVLTPVDNPSAYGLVETDADGRVRRFLEKPKPDEITCDTINAGIYVLEPDTFDRIPEGRAVLDRARLLPVADRAQRDVRRLRRSRLLDRHRHAGEVRAGAPRHVRRPLRRRAVRDGRSHRSRSCRPTRAIEDGATFDGPCFIDAGAHVKAGARSAPTPCSAAAWSSKKRAESQDTIVWPNSRIGQDAVVRRPDHRPQLPHRPQRRRRAAAPSSATRPLLTDFTEHQTHASINPSVFKAYDVRGLYPSEITEDLFHQLGRAFVAYLGPGPRTPSRATCACRRRR